MFNYKNRKHKTNSGRTLFVNVQNKSNIGGIETLVSDFRFILNQKSVPNIDFFLANNKITIYLFSKSLSRKVVIIYKSMNLLLMMYIQLFIKNYRNVYVFFYHAECHIVLRVLLPLLKYSNKIIVITYLCQSPDIYPQKLLNGVRAVMKKSNVVICYSETVAKLWRNLESVPVHSIFSPIKMERVYEAELYPSQMSEGLNLVHVGRNVAYKAPEKSLEFAIQVARISPKVCLTFIGIRSFPEMTNYTIPENLEIKFLGLVQNSLHISKDASAMLNFANYRLTGEVIGIAALESLAIGVPVIVNSLDESGYSILPGILTSEQFLKLLIQKKEIDHNEFAKFRLEDLQIKEIREELSLELYFDRINSLIRSRIG